MLIELIIVVCYHHAPLHQHNLSKCVCVFELFFLQKSEVREKNNTDIIQISCTSKLSVLLQPICTGVLHEHLQGCIVIILNHLKSWYSRCSWCKRFVLYKNKARSGFKPYYHQVTRFKHAEQYKDASNTVPLLLPKRRIKFWVAIDSITNLPFIRILTFIMFEFQD